MRRLVLLTILCASLPAAAIAQDGASRSPEDFVCELTGECAAEAGETETTGERGKARVALTRGFSLSRPAKPGSAAKPAGSASASAPRQAAPAARPGGNTGTKTAFAVSKPKPAAVRPGRVDLRLSFPLASAELTPQAKAEARVFAQALQLPQLSSKKFVIEGHTDAQGSREYNLELSRRRARAVAEYLTSLGVSSDRFEVRGYGFDRPLPGRSAASQDNRRVEAVLIS
jgi:OmpA-OmpF porin, OOP family